MATKEALHRLIDSILEKDLDSAQRALEPLVDPVLLALANAPLDDEPETDEEHAAVAEAREEYQQGKWVSAEEVRRELGG